MLNLLNVVALSLSLLARLASPQGENLELSSTAGLFIGVSEFASDPTIPAVPYAVDDAIELAYELSIERKLIAPASVVLCLGGQPVRDDSREHLGELRAGHVRVVNATKDTLSRELRGLKNVEAKGGTLVVACFTQCLAAGGPGQLYASDSVEVMRGRSTLSLSSLGRYLRLAPFGRKILLLDVAREGLRRGFLGDELAPSPIAGIRNELEGTRGIELVLSAEPGAFSGDDTRAQRGLFMTRLRRVLGGDAAATPGGKVTLAALSRLATQGSGKAAPREASAPHVVRGPKAALAPQGTTRGFEFESPPMPAGLGFRPEGSVGVFVGISQFGDDYQKVPYAVDDAVDLAHVFVYSLKVMEAKNVVLCLAGEPQDPETQVSLKELLADGASRREASAAEIQDVCVGLRARGSDSGLLVVSFATHGVIDPQERLLASDARATTLSRTSITLEELSQWIGGARCARKVLFVDACRERVLRRKGKRSTVSNSVTTKFLNRLGQFRGSASFFGAPRGGFAYDDERAKNGVFTSALLSGLGGAAPADDSGYVSVDTLSKYADEYVAKWVKDNRGNGETGGVTLHCDPNSIREMPLAPHPLLFKEVSDLRARAEDVIARLGERTDLTSLRGDFTQALADGLRTADPEALKRALRSLEPITTIRFAGVEALEDWWANSGSKLLPASGAAFGTHRGAREESPSADLDGNDTDASATRCAFGTAIKGEIGGPSDGVDVFRYTPESDGYATFSLAYRPLPGGGKPDGGIARCYVTSRAQQRLAEFDLRYLGVAEKRSVNPIALSKGEPCYVFLEGGGGARTPYSLSSSFVPLEGEDPWEARERGGPTPSLTAGEAVAGRLGFQGDQVDTFELLVPGPGTMRIFLRNTAREGKVVNGEIGAARVSDSTGKELFELDLRYKGPGSREPAASAYVVVSEPATFGITLARKDALHATTYELWSNFEPIEGPLDREPNDTPLSAQELELGTDSSGIVGAGSDDVDWFTFVAPRAGAVILSVTNQLQKKKYFAGGLGDLTIYAPSGDPVATVNTQYMGPSETRRLKDGPFQVEAGQRYTIAVPVREPGGGVMYSLGVNYAD